MTDSRSLVGRSRWRKCLTGEKTTKRIKTKLTDLNNDCLRTIFKYLNSNDIIKMFAVHNCFIDSACDAFKYVCRNVPLNIYFSPLDDDYMDPDDIQNAIKNVGSLITDLKISGRISDNVLDRHNDDVMREIVKHCPALTDLKLQYIDTNFQLENFRRFQNLNKLKINFCNFGGQMAQLQNVTHFHGTMVPETDRFLRLCDSRQHYFQRKTPNMSQDDLLAFFNVNPQLRCVKLLVKFTCESQCYSNVVTSRFLQCMNERLHMLDKLKLDLGQFNINYANRQSGSRYFRNLRKLVVTACGNLEDITNYLGEISFEQLEELRISATLATGRSLMSIHKCQNVKKVTLNLKQFLCTAADIIDLLSGCQLLQCLYIKCNQDITPQLIKREFYKTICHFLRNRTDIQIILSIARQSDVLIDEATINHYNSFKLW